MSSKFKQKKSFKKEVNKLKKKRTKNDHVINIADFRQSKKVKDERSILVVDDDDVIRGAMKRILEKENQKVYLAKDGFEFSNIIESVSLDIVFLDIDLPWVNGYELCTLIKNSDIYKHIPIVMMSGSTSKAEIESAFEAGCNEFIAKPFDINTIIKTLHHFYPETKVV